MASNKDAIVKNLNSDAVSNSTVSNSQKKAFNRYRMQTIKSGGTSLLSIALLILIGVAFVRFSLGKLYIPSFTELLNLLENVPTPELGFLNLSISEFGSDWGIFEILKDFIVALSRIVDCLIFFVNGLLTVINYVLYFCRWAFSGIGGLFGG